VVANYQTALKNKQNELIRKALEGSALIADVTASPITTLTSYSASATAGQIDGTGVAVNIATGGNLVLDIKGTLYTTTLLAADTPASVVTKINTAITGVGTASLVTNVLRIVTTDTGSDATIKVVSGTGTVLTNLFLTVNQRGVGKDIGVNLNTLPGGWDDLGWLSTDGSQFSRDVSASDVSSWGSVTPTRSDITSDTSTLTVVAQETKLLTIGLATGADLAAITATPNTGEVSIAKPTRPSSKHYRALSVAVDLGDAGEIYIARFFPRAKVSNYAEQSFGGGDDPITWGVTLTGEEDSTLGYSERWLFGGPGWLALLTDMGIPFGS
jgi:hypothetical protein